MSGSHGELLAPDEPPPFTVVGEHGRSRFFLTCDHGGNRLPRALGTLGVALPDLERHIAWDIGADGLARRLARELDAFLIVQAYSRLAIDCNRSPDAPSSIVTLSEATAIPGNMHLSPADAASRRRAIFEPYHDRIRAELDARSARRQPTILVAVHSFTPQYLGQKRPWHIGILSNRDRRLADLLLAHFRAQTELVVGDNEPYSVSDDNDYTIPVHGERRRLPHVEIEIRQDLLADDAGQTAWALRLAGALRLAEERLNEPGLPLR